MREELEINKKLSIQSVNTIKKISSDVVNKLKEIKIENEEFKGKITKDIEKLSENNKKPILPMQRKTTQNNEQKISVETYLKECVKPPSLIQSMKALGSSKYKGCISSSRYFASKEKHSRNIKEFTKVNDFKASEYHEECKIRPDFKYVKEKYVPENLFLKIKEIFEKQKFERFLYKGYVYNYHYKNYMNDIDVFLKKILLIKGDFLEKIKKIHILELVEFYKNRTAEIYMELNDTKIIKFKIKLLIDNKRIPNNPKFFKIEKDCTQKEIEI